MAKERTTFVSICASNSRSAASRLGGRILGGPQGRHICSYPKISRSSWAFSPPFFITTRPVLQRPSRDSFTFFFSLLATRSWYAPPPCDVSPPLAPPDFPALVTSSSVRMARLRCGKSFLQTDQWFFQLTLYSLRPRRICR